jgi:helicase SWR1
MAISTSDWTAPQKLKIVSTLLNVSTRIRESFASSHHRDLEELGSSELSLLIKFNYIMLLLSSLTGADTVVFYDSDFNPQMDRQCEDRYVIYSFSFISFTDRNARAHRIGQIRDVHIYRFVSQHTVEEAMLRKANQKRSLDDIVIQKGEFDWRTLFNDEGALSKALGEFEDTEDAHAAVVAAREEIVMEGADEADFGGDADGGTTPGEPAGLEGVRSPPLPTDAVTNEDPEEEPEEEPEEGGSVVEYMIKMVQRDYVYFREWRL